jgi:hypothetical protein
MSLMLLKLVSVHTSQKEQIQFLLTGTPVTQVREEIRTTEVTGRSDGTDRDPEK